MAENRCRRCNRVLMDPDAVYGWRCAKKLGVSRYMMLSDGAMWQYFYDGIAIGDIIIKNENLQLSYEEMLEMYDATIKWSLANGVGDDELMELAYNKDFPLFLFIDLYKKLYGDINREINQTTQKPNIHSLQKYLNLQNYTHDLGHRIDAVELINEYLTMGYVVLPDGSIIDNEHYDVKNPLMDFEVSFQRELLQPKQSDFDVGSFLWTTGGIANTAIGSAATAIEKSQGKINKKEVDKATKAVLKNNEKLLGDMVVKHAGRIAKDSTYTSIAYCGIEICKDYFDDQAFGEDSVKAIVDVIVTSAAAWSFATIGAGIALPTGAIVAMTVVATFAASVVAKKGVDYINSKRGKAELQELSDNLMQSMLNNPDIMSEATAQLAKTNSKVDNLVKYETMLAENEVGEYIMGTKDDAPSVWTLTKQEYNMLA